MSIRLNAPRALLLLTCWLSGCGNPASEEPAPDSHSGLRTQGKKMQGTQLQGIRLLGARLGQTDITGLQLVGTALSGQLGPQALHGQDFIGARLEAVDASGNQLQVTIQDITLDPQDPSGQTNLYSLLSYNPATGSSQDACDPDADGVRQAIPVAGTWDPSGAHADSPTSFTFGCTSGVIAKCVRWGYRPWQSVGQQSLALYHQACTRLARAPPPPDGQSHTEEGTLVDVYDDLKVLTPVPSSGLIFDAAWTTGGAYCIQKERWFKLQNLPTFSCAADFANLELVEPDPAKRASPINGDDQCLFRRMSLSRDAVHIDNRSGINAKLQ